MKIEVEKKALGKGLAQVCAILSHKKGPDWQKYIWLNADDRGFCIMTTDGEIELTASCAAAIQKTGFVGVKGDIFKKLAAAITCNPIFAISYTEKESFLKLNVRTGKFMLPVYDPDQFQSFSTFPESAPALLSGETFCKNLDRVIKSIGDDSKDNQAIGCLLMKPCQDGKNVEFCALNNHKFQSTIFSCESLCAKLPPKGLLIRKKYAQKIKKWMGSKEIELNFDDKRLYMRQENQMISFPLTVSEYPDCGVFMSRFDSPNVAELTLGLNIIKSILNKVPKQKKYSILHTVHLRLKPDEVFLEGKCYDEGLEECCSWEMAAEAKLTGPLEIQEIGFPTRDLDFLDQYVSDEISFTFTAVDGPCMIQGKDDIGFKTVIMPLRPRPASTFSPSQAEEEAVA